MPARGAWWGERTAPTPPHLNVSPLWGTVRMGALLSFFRVPSSCRRSQSSGLSPSPTDEVGQKAFGLTEGSANDDSKITKQTVDDVKPGEEPESIDTSYGVEATAVRTLAASTGTVAILGTTAKALEANEAVNDDLSTEEQFKGNPSISVTEAEPELEESDVPEIKETVDVLDKHYDNSVVQQKEIKQIVNEALQERQSEKDNGVSYSKTSTEAVKTAKQDIDETKTEESGRNVSDKDSQEKPSGVLGEEVIFLADEVKASQSLSKEESQLPKIVDFQEKKATPHLKESEKLDFNAPVIKDITEKEVVHLSETEDKALKEAEVALVVKLDKAEEEKKEALSEKLEEVVAEQDIEQLQEEQNKDVKEKEVEDVKDKEDVAESQVEDDSDASPAGTEFLSPEDETKLPPVSERLSPDISKTEDENEISSEQLKTNSLSDMSISEGLNSEGEEAAREAAKALELQEIVASLSASANEASFDFREADLSDEYSVGTSGRRTTEKELTTHDTIFEEKLSPESNGEDNMPEFPQKRDDDTHKLLAFESPDTSEPASNESNVSSKPTEESKISDKEEVTETESVKERKNVNNIIEVKEKDKPEIQDNKTAEENYNEKLTAAATTIQSSFRGYKARKDLNASEKDDDALTTTDGANTTMQKKSDELSSSNKEENESPGDSDDVFLEKDLEESPEKVRQQSQGSADKPSEETYEDITLPGIVDSVVASAPESLVRIAQAEVDRICLEAEQTTESMILPPPVVYPDTSEVDYQDDNEEFPAPPDDLLDMNGKTDTTRDDQDSSGTEPTIPLGTNEDGDSSKTEDTTAPSFAESEVKSNAPTPTPKNEDNKLESSITENITAEVAINRDSTEGELTMEEDSKDEDIGSVLQTTKGKDMSEKSSESGDLEANQEKAATVLQAGFRGYKTRQHLKKDLEETTSETIPSGLDAVGKESSLPTVSGTTENLSDSVIKAEISTASKPSEVRPKRPDQIDVIPKHEQPLEEGIILSEDISPPENSNSKDDTSSTSLSETELNEKASKIQAGVRGYLVRKDQKAKKEAAIKIQSTYRGFKARMRLKQDEASAS